MRTLAAWPVLAAAPAGVDGQPLALGAAVDPRSGGPLACLEVALQDSTGVVIALGWTDDRGLFQLPAPEAGPLTVRFRIGGFRPVSAPAQVAGSEHVAAPVYGVLFDQPLESAHAGRPPDDTASYAEPSTLVPPGRGPRYPEALKASGIEGSTTMQYVIDTAGTVVPGSIRTMSATRPEFAESVQRFVRAELRYRPARRGGRRVCLLMQQRFEFRMAP